MILSIIVPIYGVEKYLRQCLDSICAQTFKDFECILVDDGSKDACPEICDEYVEKDCRFKVIHKQNAGYGAAVNTGFDLAHGEWIAIVEPDDWIEPDMYTTLLKESGDASADIIKGNFNRVWGEASFRANTWSIKPPLTRFTVKDYPYFLSDHPSIWSAIYRRMFLEKNCIRMKEAPGGGWTDNPFLVATMCQAKGIVCIDKPLYNYRASVDDVVALKGNWRIPYDRMIEIHNWFAEHNILDAKILCTRYHTHLYYLFTISRCVTKQNRNEVAAAVCQCAKTFNTAAVYGSDFMSTAEKLMVFDYRYIPKVRMYRNTHPIINRFFRIFEKCYGRLLVRLYKGLVLK